MEVSSVPSPVNATFRFFSGSPTHGPDSRFLHAHLVRGRGRGGVRVRVRVRARARVRVRVRRHAHREAEYHEHRRHAVVRPDLVRVRLGLVLGPGG